MSNHTPSLATARETFVDGAQGEFVGEDFDRMIEAVRAEEREKAAKVAENLYFGGGTTGSANRWGAKRAAARIREQGKGQGL